MKAKLALQGLINNINSLDSNERFKIANFEEFSPTIVYEHKQRINYLGIERYEICISVVYNDINVLIATDYDVHNLWGCVLRSDDWKIL